MTQEGERFGRRLRRAATRLLVFSILVVLLAAVTFLVSQLNSRRYRFTKVGDTLVVLKGRPLPVGARPYQPHDPKLAEAYSGFPLHGTDPGPLIDRTFDDRDEMDRALFELLRALAEPRLQSPSSDRQQEGLYYLQRAGSLQGLGPEQRQLLTRMQTDVAFFRGRSLLDHAERNLQEALSQLSYAAHTENPHTREAQQMLLAVEAPARALDENLRRAVHELSAPPAAPLPPAALDAGVSADTGGATSTVPASPQ